jgi:trafficking protein particle complex subunit 6
MSFDTPLPPFNASDPHATFLNSSCLDLLLIELVPMAYRLANELSVSEERLDDEEEREAVFYRLEMLGYRVGQGLVERYVINQYKPQPRSLPPSPPTHEREK